MVEHAAGPASPLAVLFMAAVIVTGLLLGLVRGRPGTGASDPDAWNSGVEGHCGDDGSSCDGH